MNIVLKSMIITLGLFVGLQAMEDIVPQDIRSKILIEVVRDNYVELDFTDFLENVCSFKSVCNNWNYLINKDFMHKVMVLGCQQICPEFLNGKLIYRPNYGSDDEMVELKIADLWNPLGGTFDLSQCEIPGFLYSLRKCSERYACNYISISTGYRKEKKDKNKFKVEIWLTPRILVEKELESTAGHLKTIFPSKWPEAPVGILWTAGGEDNKDHYDYLTTENMESLSKFNLYESWERGTLDVKVGSWVWWNQDARESGRIFQFLF